MSIDLERSLHDLARSVQDDAASERMAGQVRHMVTRIRRRRHVRQAATGVVGAGAATAVVVGGLQLAGRGPLEASPAGWSAAAWGCEPETPTELPDPPVDVEVSHPAAAASGTVTSLVVSAHEPDPDATAVEVAPTVVLVRDGVVVSRPAALTGTMESFPVQHAFDLSLTSCLPGSAPLPPGTYDVLVRQEVVRLGVQVVAVQHSTLEVTATREEADELADRARTAEPSPAPTAAPTTAPEGSASAGGSAPATQADVDALLAQAPQGTFPACASAVLSEADPPLTLDLTLEQRPYAPGEAVGGTVGLRATGGRTVIANAPTHGALLVLTRAGAVVGREYRDTEDVELVEASGQPVDVALTGSMSLCSAPAQELPAGGLPPGRYDAYAVMEVMLKEVTEADGTARAETRSVVVRSEPVPVTIG
ncbi:hypothetical protein ICW40_17350 [Actinotalea ferrariae]|uniref:hypothetical protein n=1 Tax=Actinotalea ferrariae TaxID=1386098 RepID=UPI001C8B7921|nr:hypothetical protein [Actinotalea ferrariae]MBX9246559.1 hypothetical protein [Actinotalea ferrariae]